ncbi:hypothetical protein N658DRAFT_428924 [Parathielavia hyrcaniae]|uniref:VOC domain-containing protein n=1 Tax=Parathielavia hyrcaniae TaxID=113614 RepID=A0AAN6T078_9PEZI|nr:hypothetical protein N658DRAFT_428924 [Parathielavia hyrcaniae]
MLPFLEVEHLPASSSFYSAIIQPLGLRYFSTEDGHFPSIVYGDSSRTAPIFQIRQVVSSRDRPLRTSHIVLSASSAAAADEAYEFALRANPDSRDTHHPRHIAESHAAAAASGASARRTTTSGGGTRVLITDFVGNMMEIVYQPPPDYPSHYNGSTVRHTRSTSEEACRILDWNYDVAGRTALPGLAGPSSASTASVHTASRRSQAARYPDDDDDDGQPHPNVRRSVTTAGSSVYEPATSARENSNGLSAGAVVGTLLGVAAGAAALGGVFTYNMAKNDRSRSSRLQEYDAPPSFSRRSTYPEKYDGYPSDRKSRYPDVEQGVEKLRRHHSDYPGAPTSDYRRPPPEYIARYSSQADSPPPPPPPPRRRSRSREADDHVVVYEDSRGRHSSSRSSRAPSAVSRPRSESATHREPYGGLVENNPWATDYHRGGGSYASSRSSTRHRDHHPPIVQRSYTYDTTPDRESYVSARSYRSNSTVRGAAAPPPPAPLDPYMTSSSSRPGGGGSSRVTTTTTTRKTYKVGNSPRSYIRAPSYISARDLPLPDSRAPTYISARDVPLPASRPGTYVSARHVPLPESRVGGTWEEDGGDGYDDDDADSVAPSDSISCVGSRGRGR